MKKFIITQDVDTALLLTKQKFQLVGQNGKVWYFLNDEDKVEINKQMFSRKSAKYHTTDKMLFDDFNGVQYIKD